MIGLDRITRRIWRFRMEETATVTIEMILMTPIMVWGFVATLQFFDAYRTEMISNKAALTIADMYSRAEHDPINSTYLNGTRSLLRYLTLAEEDPDFRVTLFHWQESKNRYRVSWSRNRGERNSHNTTTINELADRLPIMVDAERALLIETWTDYTPRIQLASATCWLVRRNS
jgi:hypothetical protein